MYFFSWVLVFLFKYFPVYDYNRCCTYVYFYFTLVCLTRKTVFLQVYFGSRILIDNFSYWLRIKHNQKSWNDSLFWFVSFWKEAKRLCSINCKWFLQKYNFDQSTTCFVSFLMNFTPYDVLSFQISKRCIGYIYALYCPNFKVH